MRRRGPGDGVVQVELVEADADLEVDGADDGGVGDARDAARGRRLRWVGLAVVVALLGTIVTATAIDARQDAARSVELAELDWVLPHIEGPLEEVWRSSGGLTVAQTDELIVLAGDQGGIRALDPATGVEAWTHDGAGVDADCSGLVDYRNVQLDEIDKIDVDFVYCQPSTGYQVRTPAAGFTVPIDFIEVATGTQMTPLVVDGKLVMSDAVDGDLLVTFVDSSAALGVLRWDPRVGEVWSYRSAPGLVPNGVVVNYFEAGVDEPAEGEPVRLSYGLADGVVRLTDAIALDLATGERVTVPPLEASSLGVYVQTLPDGGSVELRFGMSSDGGSSETARVLNADGSLRFEIDGYPWFSSQTDGSDADVLTVFRPDGRVAGTHPETGQTRWTTVAMADPVFVLEDVMVLVGSTGVLAIDVHDGEERWHAEEDAVWNATAATDGDVVLVQVEGEAGPELLALDLRTGAEAWRTPISGITGSDWQLDHGGGNLLLFGDDEIVALG